MSLSTKEVGDAGALAAMGSGGDSEIARVC